MAATKSGSSQMYTNTRKMYAQLSCTYVCTVKHACTHARTGIGLVKAGECDGSREGKPTTQASVTEARPGIPARWTPANCPHVNAGTFCPIRQSFLALLASTNHVLQVSLFFLTWFGLVRYGMEWYDIVWYCWYRPELLSCQYHPCSTGEPFSFATMV